MSVRSRDTTVEAAKVHAAALRRLGLEGRARMTFELSDNLRAVTEAGIRHRHPDYDEEQVRLALIRAMLGDELFDRFYGDRQP